MRNPVRQDFHTGYSMFSLRINELWVTVHWITMKTCRIPYENACRTVFRILSITTVATASCSTFVGTTRVFCSYRLRCSVSHSSISVPSQGNSNLQKQQPYNIIWNLRSRSEESGCVSQNDALWESWKKMEQNLALYLPIVHEIWLLFHTMPHFGDRHCTLRKRRL